MRAALVDCRLRPSSVPGAAVAMVHRLPKAASPQRKAAIIAADAVSHSESPPASPGVHSQPPYNYSYILIVCSSMGKFNPSMMGRFFRADNPVRCTGILVLSANRKTAARVDRLTRAVEAWGG